MSLAGTFLAHTALLGALATPGNTNQTGTAWAILESSTDDVEAAQQKYAVSIHISQVGAGTVRAQVLTSHDAIKWCVAAASTILTEDGDEIYEVLEPTRLLRHVAVVTVLTGNPKPSHTFSASLLSNGRIRLIRTGKTVDPALAIIDIPRPDDARKVVVALDGKVFKGKTKRPSRQEATARQDPTASGGFLSEALDDGLLCGGDTTSS